MFRVGSEGYDIALTLFNPQGRLQQLEYAHRVIDRGLPIIGVTYKEGIVIGAAKVESKLIDKRKFHKVFAIDEHIAAAFVGMSSDARVLIDRLRTQCQMYRLTYDKPPSPYEISNELAQLLHIYTMYAGIRPFGVVLLIGGVYNNKKQLIYLTPDGSPKVFKAWGAGMGGAEIRDLLEKEYNENMTLLEAYNLIKRSIERSLDKKISPDNLEFAIIPIKTKKVEIIYGNELINRLEKRD